MSLSVVQYIHSISVGIYLCTHPHCTNTTNPSFDLYFHVTMGHVTLDEHGASETTAVHEVEQEVGCSCRTSRAS